MSSRLINTSTWRAALIICAAIGAHAYALAPPPAFSIGTILDVLRGEFRHLTDDLLFTNADYIAARQNLLEQQPKRLTGLMTWYEGIPDPALHVVLRALQVRRDSPPLAAAFDEALEQFQSHVLVADMLEKTEDVAPQHLEALPSELAESVVSLRTHANDDAADDLKSFTIDPSFTEHFDDLAFEAILTSWGRPEARVHLVQAVAAQPEYQPQRLKRLWAVAHSGQPGVVREAAATALKQGIKALKTDELTDDTLDELFEIYKVDRMRDCRPTDPVLEMTGALKRAGSKRALEHAEEIVRLEREVYMPRCDFAPWEKSMDVLNHEVMAITSELGSAIVKVQSEGKSPLTSKEVVLLQRRQRQVQSRMAPTILWESANELVDKLRKRHDVAAAPDEETTVLGNQEQ